MKEEKELKDLLDKAENIDTRNVDDLRNELRKKLQELRDQKMYPKGYAKIINEKLGIEDRNKVYHTISGAGKRFSIEIARELVTLASKKKLEEELIEQADKILKSK